jgi:hypothetical protein
LKYNIPFISVSSGVKNASTSDIILSALACYALVLTEVGVAFQIKNRFSLKRYKYKGI